MFEEEIKYFRNIEKEFREAEFERRDDRLKNAKPQKLIRVTKKIYKLNVVFVMTWTDICGGSKVILEEANKLSSRGHKVTIISHWPKPTWFNMKNEVDFIQVELDKVLGESIPKCDLIVVTYWRDIYECMEQKIAPVVYYEQGDAHLYEQEKYTEKQLQHIQKQFDLVPFIFTVSNFAKDTIKEKFNRESTVIPISVEETVFFNKIDKKAINDREEIVNIAVIGSENSKFKNITKILDAIKILKDNGYNIHLSWISPDNPVTRTENAIVNPPQMTIGDTLRASDIFICASMYESFPLPVLEAMNCGAAVITTDNGGVRDYTIDNINCLRIEKNSVQDIVEKIERLINDKELRVEISNKGMETARNYSWNKTIDMLEEYFRELSSYEVE